MTEVKAVDETHYRFLALHPEDLRTGSPISLSWTGAQARGGGDDRQDTGERFTPPDGFEPTKGSLCSPSFREPATRNRAVVARGEVRHLVENIPWLTPWRARRAGWCAQGPGARPARKKASSRAVTAR